MEGRSAIGGGHHCLYAGVFGLYLIALVRWPIFLNWRLIALVRREERGFLCQYYPSKRMTGAESLAL
jgi:hypothetical protein